MDKLPEENKEKKFETNKGLLVFSIILLVIIITLVIVLKTILK